VQGWAAGFEGLFGQNHLAKKSTIKGINARFLPVFPAKTGVLVYLFVTWSFDAR
jgi:hypothetical protein